MSRQAGTLDEAIELLTVGGSDGNIEGEARSGHVVEEVLADEPWALVLEPVEGRLCEAKRECGFGEGWCFARSFVSAVDAM